MPLRNRAALHVAAAASAVLVASFAFADDESDRQSYLGQIDSKLSYAVSELSGVKSDSDDSDIKDADRYIDEVRDLVSRLSNVKGEDQKARDVVDRYPRLVEQFKVANAALRNMKGYQSSNVSLMKVCQDKNAELLAQARDFETRNDPEGLEKLPRIASEAKNATVRFLEEADKFGNQMEEWRRTVHYFDVSNNVSGDKWPDIRSILLRESSEIQDFWKHDRSTAEDRCKDLKAGPDHPVVKEVLEKLASSSAGRKEVIENLNKLIGEMAGKIKDVPGASGTYGVDYVREKLDAIESTLSILERRKGSDASAKKIAETWPAIAREARNSIEPLRELKTHHHVMDDLPGKCREMESKLDSFISANGDDSDGVDAIPAFATELGNPVIVGMGKAKERLDLMDADRDRVESFTRSEGPWSDVVSAYRTAADTIYDFYAGRYQETEAACRDIMKTVEHPDVKSAIDRLRGKAGTTSETLEDDVEDWVERARATYKLDCDAMEQMWEAYCSEDMEPGSNEAKARAKATSDNLKATMQAAIAPILSELPPLAQRVAALIAKKETKKRGEQLERILEKERKRLAKLAPSDAKWQGSYNPHNGYLTEYGTQQHQRLWSEFDCDVPLAADKEAVFPGSEDHRKPDCIIADKCEVWEFKPDSPTGRRDGREQADDYRIVVPRYYTEVLKKQRSIDDYLGGVGLMTTLKAKCADGDAIELAVDVHYYKMCENRYECIRGD